MPLCTPLFQRLAAVGPVDTVRQLSQFLRGFLEVARLAPEAVDRLVLVAPMGFGKMARLGKVLIALAWLWNKATLRPLPYPALSFNMEGSATDAFRSVNAPTLVVWGRRDPYFPAMQADRALAFDSNARLELFEKSGHAPHREAPERFNRVALTFFASTR